jgi:hypothetical protein
MSDHHTNAYFYLTLPLWEGNHPVPLVAAHPCGAIIDLADMMHSSRYYAIGIFDRRLNAQHVFQMPRVITNQLCGLLHTMCENCAQTIIRRGSAPSTETQIRGFTISDAMRNFAAIMAARNADIARQDLTLFAIRDMIAQFGIQTDAQDLLDPYKSVPLQIVFANFAPERAQLLILSAIQKIAMQRIIAESAHGLMYLAEVAARMPYMICDHM